MAITWRVPVLLLLGIGLVALRPRASTVLLWVVVVLVVVLLDLRLAPSPRLLALARGPLPRTRVSEPVQTRLRVRNGSGRPVRGLVRDAWQPSAGARGHRHRLRLRGHGETELTSVLLPSRRGALRTDRVTVRSLGPLGLAARQTAAVVPGELRVLPAFPSRRHLPGRLARLRELDGRAAVRVRGAGTEFDSLREYVRGDDVRSIDWRATARTGGVVVRTWQPERDRRVVVVLDTGRTSAGRVGDVPRLDAAMDAALLLTALAGRAGDRVDFVAGDRVVRSRLRGGHSGDVLTRMQDEMAQLQPDLQETSWRRLVGAVDQLGRHRALVVLLTPVEPSAVLHGLLPLVGPLCARHRVVLASVRDPALAELARRRGDADEVHAAAAAEQALARRDHTSRMLAALGVDVLDDDADALPPRLADHYLDLKARGLL